MAAIPVTLSGVLYDLTARTSQRVVLIAEASLTGVGVGGGPVYPDIPPPDKPPEKPPGIWGGPIDPYPGHPLPEPPPRPIDPPPVDPPTMVKPPPPEGGWAYTPQWGWGYYPGSTHAGPK